MNSKLFGAIALVFAGAAASGAQAATVTANMPVTITLVNACNVSTVAPTTLNFGNSVGLLDAAIDQTSTITVTCSNGAGYDIGLGAGTSTGATVTTRKMTGPASATVNYQLFKDTARTANWGDTGTDRLHGIGNGTSQPLTVYGRVPVQTTPAAGTYTDTVAVTVTY